ncbi:mechanosensitive ion channel domain-containing protein [Halorientalis brevis]|uniref:Mechanosensitive ion channel domain-containing protein n=1 Tax=Halorientalis brevis TaxID=1126241 RepID=A0ABD6CFA5_9EURY|nr:mechanosensitive ion channel domain-containing protein [Halorientalis brevis]
MFLDGLSQYVTTSRFLLASAIFVVGLVIGYTVSRLARRVLEAFGLSETVEGTAFERTARGLGTSTVGVLSQIVALAIYISGALAALQIAELLDTYTFWTSIATFLPQVFIAALAVIVGLVIGEKAGLLVSERLRGVKLPEVGVIPTLVKYSVFYIAALIALSQLGVATNALLVMLAAYVFGVVFLGGLAFKDLLAAGAAGVYLLLNEPYSIGDEIRVQDNTGIVQEVDLFVTHIENDGEEYIIPNQRVFQNGIVRVRD